MNAESNTLLRGVQSKDLELVQRSLSKLRSLINSNTDSHLYRGPQAGHLVRAMLELLHLKSMPGGLLELNFKAIRDLLELESNSLQVIKTEDYNLICQCLENADLSHTDGKKSAKDVIKVRDN